MFKGRYGKLLSDIGKMADLLRDNLDILAEAVISGKDIPDMVPRILPGMFYWRIMQKPVARINTNAWRKVAKKNGADVDAKPYLE